MSKNSVPGSGTKTQAYYPKPLLGTKASSMFEPAKKPETPPQWHGFRALVLKKFPKATVTKADRKSTRLNSSHIPLSRMPSSA